jgi:hypothetical protein
VVESSALPAGTILQVIQAVKTDTFSSSSSSFVSVTGLSATITPSSSSNKVLVMVDMVAAASGGSLIIQSQLNRNATPVYIGDASGSNARGFQAFDGINLSTYGVIPHTAIFLDSPATTSAVTYDIKMRSDLSTTWYVNRVQNATTADDGIRTASSITVMEVAG